MFCRYGVNSVGVDAIVEAAGTAKTTLYKLFGSKDGLVEVVLEREGQAWRAWFLAEIDGPGGSAAERLARIGPALKQWFSRRRLLRLSLSSTRSGRATRPTTACARSRSRTRRSC